MYKESAWKKTLQLIEEKYGKTLQYRSLKLLNDQKKTAYNQGDDFIIPLSLKNQDLGNVIVTRGSFLSEEQKAEIIDLIKFLVEPQVYNLHLKTAEQNILNQSADSNTDRNKIVQLYEDYKIYENQKPKKMLSQIIHLKALASKNRHKVALKIHEMTERNLFVRFQDVVNATTTSADLLTLNDTTLFINDIEDLTEHELQLLESFVNQTNQLVSENHPIVLIGSNLLMQEIDLKNWNQCLKKDLMGFYFDIDRVPLEQQTSPEILDLLFFEINEPMS